jgi:fatty acid desaturase
LKSLTIAIIAIAWRMMMLKATLPRMASGVLSWRARAIRWQSISRPGDMAREGQRHWIATELIVAVMVQGLIWKSGIGTLKGIALSLYAANALAAIPGIWLVHRGCRHGDSDIARSTRSRLVTWLSAGMFHHAEHHAFPAVPTCHLSELAHRIDAQGSTPPSIADDFASRK